MTATMTIDFDAVRARQKALWSAGDFGQIARLTENNAEEFVKRCAITPGMTVLDIACGTGNTALPAARAGAEVTGIDLAPNLVEQARARAAREDLAVRFDEGDMEELPYADGAFDFVMSTFGIMFALRPNRAASELIRVCRPGGRIALANWTPHGFIGQLQQIVGKHAPTPPGGASPLLWGDETTVRERLNWGLTALQARRVMAPLHYPFSIAETISFHRTYLGPARMTYETMAAAQREAMEKDLTALYGRHNLARDGTVLVESEYLEITGKRI